MRNFHSAYRCICLYQVTFRHYGEACPAAGPKRHGSGIRWYAVYILTCTLGADTTSRYPHADRVARTYESERRYRNEIETPVHALSIRLPRLLDVPLRRLEIALHSSLTLIYSAVPSIQDIRNAPLVPVFWPLEKIEGTRLWGLSSPIR